MSRYAHLSPKQALQLASPPSWAASVLPALFGILYSLWSGLSLSLGMAAVLLLICVLMQSSVNTLNDYFDFVKGADSAGDNLEKEDAVLLHNPLNPRHVLLLGFGFLLAAGALGLWVVARAGFAPLAIGAVGGLIVLLYSGGPLPISYLPAGELVSGFVMGGLIPVGIVAVAAGEIRWAVLLHAAPLILGIGLIMMTNNTCDIEKDTAAGRRTLTVMLGRLRARNLYRVLVALWLAMLCFAPPLVFGPRGLLCPALLLVSALPVWLPLFRGWLNQDQRVANMKSILKANLVAGGALLLTMAAALL